MQIGQPPAGAALHECPSCYAAALTVLKMPAPKNLLSGQLNVHHQKSVMYTCLHWCPLQPDKKQ